MSEVSHLPQLVKVQKESLKETIEFEWHYKLHKCVESIEEIPKLKLYFNINTNREKSLDVKIIDSVTY